MIAAPPAIPILYSVLETISICRCADAYLKPVESTLLRHVQSSQPPKSNQDQAISSEGSL